MEEIAKFIAPIIETLGIKYPFIMSFFAIMGVARMVFKPLMTFLHEYVSATPSKNDDLKLEKFEKSKLYKVIAFLFDYIFSIKIQKK